MPSKSHTCSTYETEQLLRQIEQEKQQAQNLIAAAIEESWVEYANAMGLVFQE
jgi:DNA-binding protein H-NS